MQKSREEDALLPGTDHYNKKLFSVCQDLFRALIELISIRLETLSWAPKATSLRIPILTKHLQVVFYYLGAPITKQYPEIVVRRWFAGIKSVLSSPIHFSLLPCKKSP